MIAAASKLIPKIDIIRLKGLIVADVMSREVFAVTAETSLETAQRLMAVKHYSGVPVIERSGKPVGAVTLSDLVDPDRQRSEAQGESNYYRIVNGDCTEVGDTDRSTTSGLVRDVMSPFVLSVKATSSLYDAAKLMIDDNVHRLFVLEDGKLEGIVSTTDLLRGFLEDE